jgi:hypothetical protein
MMRAYHRRALSAAAVGAFLTLMAGSSYAADPPPQLPPAGGGGATAAPPPAPPPGRPPNTVRVNLTAYRNKGVARLYVAKGEGNYALVCQAPCKADVVPGTPLRVTHGSDTGADEGHDFNMAGNPGDDVDIEVRPPSKGALAGGIVLLSVGGVTALFGLLFVAIGSSSGVRNRDDYKTGGWIATAIGAGLTVAGIVLLMNRSKEPRITENEHAPNKGEGLPITNKTDLFRSDVASLKPADPWSNAAPAIMPFQYSVSF